MSDKTKISWTDSTWNVSRGCSKVSDGCRNCYAEAMANRFSGAGMPYEGTITDGRWNGRIRLAPKVLDQPLRWQRPRRIFVNSMSDLFHPDVPDDYIDQVFAVMALCPQHTFQVLTKRPERMLEYFTPSACNDKLGDLSPWMEQWGWISPEDAANIAPPGSTLPKWPEWPLPNVWLGVSVENQKAADDRIPLLLETPAAIRWLSCEPLLGPVDLNAVPRPDNAYFAQRGERGCITDPNEPDDYVYWHKRDQIHWVVVGGESGRNARPMHPDWARSLRDQCQAAGVPFHFKQWGEWAPHDRTATDSDPEFWIAHQGPAGYVHTSIPPSDYGLVEYMNRIGKAAAGRMLDGRIWDEYPEARR